MRSGTVVSPGNVQTCVLMTTGDENISPIRGGRSDWIWWVLVVVVAVALSATPRIDAAAVESATNPTIVVRDDPDDNRDNIALFETDAFNSASLCAQGILVSKDHRSRGCRLGRSRSLDLGTTFGGTTLTMFATRSSYDSDGGNGLREEVLILDEKRYALHTLVQWRQDSFDEHSTTLRRRFRIVNVDDDGDDELCVESTTTTGPGRFSTAAVYRPQQRHTGYDAFTWSSGRLVRAESLDGGCPQRGYQMFVTMPLTGDPVHRSRDR